MSYQKTNYDHLDFVDTLTKSYESQFIVSDKSSHFVGEFNTVPLQFLIQQAHENFCSYEFVYEQSARHFV